MFTVRYRHLLCAKFVLISPSYNPDHWLMRNLIKILESRDYDLLFGRMDAITGLRSQGLLDQFNNPHIDSTVIALNVAEQLVNKGLFEDAITMYDIAGVNDQLFKAGFMSEVDTDAGDTLNKKVRNAQLAQFNYILVVGDREKNAGTVNERQPSPRRDVCRRTH